MAKSPCKSTQSTKGTAAVLLDGIDLPPMEYGAKFPGGGRSFGDIARGMEDRGDSGKSGMEEESTCCGIWSWFR